MSDQDLKSIASATRRIPALQNQPEPEKATGNAQPAPGNDVPAPARVQPDLEALTSKLNIASRSIGRDLRFKVDMNSGSSVIQVLDRETGEVIREIPPEKAAISVAANGDVELRLYDRVV